MRTRPVDWVDAFTDTPLTGNGCAVVHDAADMPVETRLAFTRETGLTECAFLVPSAVADFGVRYYLHHREIAMAGHPTVATIASLRARGLIGPDPQRLTLEVGSGVLPIRVDAEGWIEMVQAAPEFGATQAPEEIAALYGLTAADIVGAPQIVSTGSAFCVTLLRDGAALDRAALDVDRLRAWQAGLGPGGAIVEPFLVVRTEHGTRARLLLPPPGPAADAFTGSATGCAAAWLFANGHVPRAFEAAQGADLGRPGRARVAVEGAPDAITGIRVAGQAHVLMSGLLTL